jgi:hypothetical protein
MVSAPGFQLSILYAPPPASLFFSQAIAHGSASVAFFLASVELMMNGTTTAMLNSSILSLRT